MPSDLLYLSALALVGSSAALLIGGFSKGSLGLGLPLIAMPILTWFVPVPQAIIILTIPIFVTNIWQAFQGGNFLNVVRRFWPMALALIIGIALGTRILLSLEPRTLYVLVGVLVLIQPVIRVLKPAFQLPPSKHRQIEAIVGFVSGAIGGVSGFFGPFLLAYLAMLRLEKNLFAATVAVMFFVGSSALALFLAQAGVMKIEDLVTSCLALIPASIGIVIGQRVRGHISQHQFDGAITTVMFVMGMSLIAKALLFH